MADPNDIRQHLRKLDSAFRRFNTEMEQLRAEQRKTITKIVARVEAEKLDRVRKELQT